MSAGKAAWMRCPGLVLSSFTSAPLWPRGATGAEHSRGISPHLFSSPARPTVPAVVSSWRGGQQAGRRVSRSTEEGAGDLPSSSSPLTAPTTRRRPSSRGSRDSRGTHGRTDEARQRAPSRQRLKPLSAESTCKAGLCLSLPVEGLVLNPAEPRRRGRPCPPSSHHTGGYRK